MKTRIRNLAAFVVIAMAIALMTGPARAATAEAQTTYAEIQVALGLVPTFLRDFPEEAIAAVWAEYKGTELDPASALPGKYKELIGLAVAAQVPCRYCIYFHTAAARLNGATDREIKEAVAVAAIVRKWSTVLNGNQIDEAEFKGEIARVLDFAKKQHPLAEAPPIAVIDEATALRDITQTLGFVPGFFRRFPGPGLAGAWLEFKTMQLNPSSAIPNKYKELIGLAVSAQIPCRYCTAFHTETSKAFGASDKERYEAIAMASITRHWSTWLNGSQQDEASFRKEVDAIVRYLKRGAARK
jgi:AhpD family alkylhydroperoxidase